MVDLVQSKFKLVHSPEGDRIKHGEAVLEGVAAVEKVEEDGIPYVLIEAALSAETYDAQSRFVLHHGEADAVMHGGIPLEGVESVEKVMKDGKPVLVIKAVLSGEDYTAILKAKEVKKPDVKAPAPKPTSKAKDTE